MVRPNHSDVTSDLLQSMTPFEQTYRWSFSTEWILQRPGKQDRWKEVVWFEGLPTDFICL